jgi:hypothetical protein
MAIVPPNPDPDGGELTPLVFEIKKIQKGNNVLLAAYTGEVGRQDPERQMVDDRRPIQGRIQLQTAAMRLGWPKASRGDVVAKLHAAGESDAQFPKLLVGRSLQGRAGTHTVSVSRRRASREFEIARNESAGRGTAAAAGSVGCPSTTDDVIGVALDGSAVAAAFCGFAGAAGGADFGVGSGGRLFGAGALGTIAFAAMCKSVKRTSSAAFGLEVSPKSCTAFTSSATNANVVSNLNSLSSPSD